MKARQIIESVGGIGELNRVLNRNFEPNFGEHKFEYRSPNLLKAPHGALSQRLEDDNWMEFYGVTDWFADQTYPGHIPTYDDNVAYTIARYLKAGREVKVVHWNYDGAGSRETLVKTIADVTRKANTGWEILAFSWDQDWDVALEIIIAK